MAVALNKLGRLNENENLPYDPFEIGLPTGGSMWQLSPELYDDAPNVYDQNDIQPKKLDTVLNNTLPIVNNNNIQLGLNPVNPVNPITTLWSKVESFGKENPILATVIVGGIGYALFGGKSKK